MADSLQGNKVVLPGERICKEGGFVGGTGTYEREGFIHSSIVGYKQVNKIKNENKFKIDIVPFDATKRATVPEQDNIVLARVTKVTLQKVRTLILCVGEKDNSSMVSLKAPFEGIVRFQDVRPPPDKVEMYKCFRPGDIIRASVVSLGDPRSYFLSTMRNDLGVIYAKSVAGSIMVPISWEMMQCPSSKMKEYRKVAKT